MEQKVTMKSLAEAVENLTKRVTELEERFSEIKIRDRGPSSTRQMTEDDARKLILGDMKDVPHKTAAEKLGLSYGQVYSARGGYTFKHLQDEKNGSSKKNS